MKWWPQNHSEMIEVIQAHAQGKEIEYRYRSQQNCGPWLSMESPQFFNFSDCDYRVKPEPPKPREFWLRMYESGGVIFPDKGSAECEGVTVVHVREVIE